jgi:uncharacterized protein with GYD domain
MPKYVILFNVTADALSRFIDNPEDRRGPVSKLAEAVGGRLESYYWMFGDYDGLGILETPDSKTAPFALAAASTGAFRRAETHELISAEDLVSVLQQAKTAKPSYRPPGATTS